MQGTGCPRERRRPACMPVNPAFAAETAALPGTSCALHRCDYFTACAGVLNTSSPVFLSVAR
jgi:hypothetical protein